jgi:uncharacterized membrane protein
MADKRRNEEHDDLWAWLVIGLILLVVTVLLYAPLVWEAMHI